MLLSDCWTANHIWPNFVQASFGISSAEDNSNVNIPYRLITTLHNPTIYLSLTTLHSNLILLKSHSAYSFTNNLSRLVYMVEDFFPLPYICTNFQEVSFLVLNDNSFIMFGVSYNGVNFYFCEDGLVCFTYGWVWSGIIRIFELSDWYHAWKDTRKYLLWSGRLYWYSGYSGI